MADQSAIDAILDAPAEVDEQPPATSVAEPVIDATDSIETTDTIGLTDDEISAGDDADVIDEDLDESSEEADVAPLDAKGLAEKLEMDIKDVYAIKFNYGDGESLTLGELKDLGGRAATIDAESESLEQSRDQFANLNMTARQELQSLVSLLPVEALSPDLLQAAKVQKETIVYNERIKLLNVIPDWKDPAIEAGARASMLENLKEYGFREVEAESMMDHRLVKLLHDYTRLRARVKPGQDAVKAFKANKGKKPNRTNSRRRQESQAYERAKEIGRTGNSRGAINAIFEG
tara:strand:- start:183 stop:1052 length:870 start_codon:yes stop_codon:yes gene_type:complete